MVVGKAFAIPHTSCTYLWSSGIGGTCLSQFLGGFIHKDKVSTCDMSRNSSGKSPQGSRLRILKYSKRCTDFINPTMKAMGDFLGKSLLTSPLCGSAL